MNDPDHWGTAAAHWIDRLAEISEPGPGAQPATPCDPALQDALDAAIRATGGAGRRLASGATHDSSAMADLCPVAMLFLACRDGISHNPAEHCPPQVMEQAVAAYVALLPRLGGGGG